MNEVEETLNVEDLTKLKDNCLKYRSFLAKRTMKDIFSLFLWIPFSFISTMYVSKALGYLYVESQNSIIVNVTLLALIPTIISIFFMIDIVLDLYHMMEFGLVNEDLITIFNKALNNELSIVKKVTNDGNNNMKVEIKHKSM